MTKQDKIKNRIKAISRMMKIHELALKRCYESGTEAGIKHNESAIKQYRERD